MSAFDRLLGTDFDEQPTSDPDDVIYGGLDDPAHRERVPGLVALMTDPAAPARERFLACLAVTTWGEPAGYHAVAEAAAAGRSAPWYEILVDRKFSVDRTFAELAVAVSDSRDLAEEKGTLVQRDAAFGALVRIADTEYFEDRLGDLMAPTTVRTLLPDLAATVGRGRAVLAGTAGARPGFDLAAQLADLAALAALADEPLAVQLTLDVLAAGETSRALVHAVTVLHRVRQPEARQRLGDRLAAAGDERVRDMVATALRTP